MSKKVKITLKDLEREKGMINLIGNFNEPKTASDMQILDLKNIPYMYTDFESLTDTEKEFLKDEVLPIAILNGEKIVPFEYAVKY